MGKLSDLEVTQHNLIIGEQHRQIPVTRWTATGKCMANLTGWYSSSELEKIANRLDELQQTLNEISL